VVRTFFTKIRPPTVKPHYYKRSFFYRPSPNTVNAGSEMGGVKLIPKGILHLIGPFKWGKVRVYDTQTALPRYLPEIPGKERRLPRLRFSTFPCGIRHTPSSNLRRKGEMVDVEPPESATENPGKSRSAATGYHESEIPAAWQTINTTVAFLL